MDGVGVINRGSGFGYVHDLAFGRVEGHLPGLLPVDQSVQVVLEVVAICRVVNFAVQHGVVSEKFEGCSGGDRGGHVVDVKEE